MAKERWNPEMEEMDRRCSDCGDWWPATREFFYPTGRKERPKLSSYCKACYEVRRKRYRKPYTPRRQIVLQSTKEEVQ